MCMSVTREEQKRKRQTNKEDNTFLQEEDFNMNILDQTGKNIK